MTSLKLTTARRAVLIIGVPIALAIIGWSALSAAAFLGQATDRFSRTVAWSGAPIRIAIDSGDVTVRPGKDDNLHVSAVVRYSLVRPALTIQTTGSSVIVTMSCRPIVVDVCSVDLTVIVPPTAVVTASSDSGDVTASDLNDASLQSDSGDVRATGLSGVTHLKTDSGSIDAKGTTASDVSALDDSGDVSLAFDAVPDTVVARDASGDVTVTVPHVGPAYNVSANSDSGTTTVSVPTDSSSVHVISVAVDSGDIHIVLGV